MNRVWTAKQIGALIGISGNTVKVWADQQLIPQPALRGLRNTRIWGRTKTLEILTFARDTAHYFVPDRCFDEVGREDETEKQ